MKPKVNFLFVCLVAGLMSVVALSIDSILPAMGYVRHKFDVPPEDGHWILTTLFFGLAIGQLFFGPLSDTIGRKTTIYVGIIIFSSGSLISFLANDYSFFIFGRFIQGLGVSAPRIVSQAIIRDVVVGTAMARLNSFVMTVFIAVPVFAPILGQFVIWTIGWSYIFVVLIVYCLTLTLIFGLTINETLKQPQKFNFETILRCCLSVFSNKMTLGFTVALGCVLGCLISFLNIAQPLYQEVYSVGDKFPFYFAGTALVIGMASLLNAKLVSRIKLDSIVTYALIWSWVCSAAFLILALNYVTIDILAFLLFSALVFTTFGFLFSNFNAMALEPMGHIAGTASALIATVSNIIALCMGAISSYFFSGSPTPLIAVFFINSTTAICIMFYLRRFSIKWTAKEKNNCSKYS